MVRIAARCGYSWKEPKMTLLAGGVQFLGQITNPTPSSTGMPPKFVSSIQTLMNWTLYTVLASLGFAAIVACGVMAFGHHTGRPDLAAKGKTGLIWAGVAAVLVGLAIPFINALFGLTQ
jgi:Type IV secretion system pilin